MAHSKPGPILPTHEHQSDRFREPYHYITPIHINGKCFKRLALNLKYFFVATWLDWLTIIVIGITAASVWIAPQPFTRLFLITTPNGAIYWPEIAYPYVKPIFSSAGAGIVSATVPIATFTLAQLWLRSFLDFSTAILGLTYSMVTGTCFQVILKTTIGGLRPHFLAVCKPVLPPVDGSTGVGFHNAMYTAEQVCTGDPWEIKNALESFPSGHAEVAFAGFGYLAIYLFAHLRITRLTWRRASHWKMLLVTAPLLFATYLASTLVLGYHHHAYDVIAGALIGWSMALLGYRMVFKGVVDARWNTMSYLKLRQRSDGQAQDGIGDSGSVCAATDAPRQPTVSDLPS